MKVSYYLFAVLLSLTYSVKTEAAATKKYEYDIPALNGVYSEPTDTNIYLDINAKFSEITSAELYLEGAAEPGSVTCVKDDVRTAVASEVRIVAALTDRIRHHVPAGTPVEGVKLADSARTNNRPPKTELPGISKPPVVDHFACSDYCPGPKEFYIEKVYQGITSEEECRKLGGRFATYVGWGTYNICIAE